MIFTTEAQSTQSFSFLTQQKTQCSPCLCGESYTNLFFACHLTSKKGILTTHLRQQPNQ